MILMAYLVIEGILSRNKNYVLYNCVYQLQNIYIYIRNPKDTANFLSLIKLLRRMLERKYPNEHKLLTTAVSAYVFLDENRQSIQTLDKDWGKHMDGFYIMVKKNEMMHY